MYQVATERYGAQASPTSRASARDTGTSTVRAPGKYRGNTTSRAGHGAATAPFRIASGGTCH